jgi:hypothetical protein
MDEDTKHRTDTATRAFAKAVAILRAATRERHALVRSSRRLRAFARISATMEAELPISVTLGVDG